VFVATITFLMSTLEANLAEMRAEMIQRIIDKNNSVFEAYLTTAIYGMSFVFMAAALTVYIAPGANGSGVGEVMGLLNGINFPQAIGLRTLGVKCVSNIFAISGLLCLGKEGPLVHIGANCGAIVCYLPISGFMTLRNDVSKRQMMAAGAAVGVSCAFGAPVGGALFAYELSKPNTFWTFSMLWRVFASCCIATFLLGILGALEQGLTFSFNDIGGTKFSFQDVSESSLLNLPGAIVIGVACGLLGSTFVQVNVKLAIIRKKLFP